MVSLEATVACILSSYPGMLCPCRSDQPLGKVAEWGALNEGAPVAGAPGLLHKANLSGLEVLEAH